jgi:L-ascorbate metabolism protein UlaG (beta-lactamase superfamily)
MKITQIRNACLLLEVGQHKILVDPMLADKGTLPGFKIFDFSGGRKPNPLVDLPPNAQGLLESATCALVTHEVHSCQTMLVTISGDGEQPFY